MPELTQTMIEQLLTIVTEVVKADGEWETKRDLILAQCNDANKVNLEEFATWFDYIEEEGEEP